MIFDVELHCDKWKGCKTKWCNNDGGFWCKEDCKLLQVRPITRKRKVEKILSNTWCSEHCRADKPDIECVDKWSEERGE